MRPVRYNVAASLDGFLGTPDGGYDWIPNDPAVDFGAIFAKVDTILIGRRSYEAALEMGGTLWSPSARVFVFSTTLDPAAHPSVTVVSSNAGPIVESLRREPGAGEIWLFGGGNLFRNLLSLGQVDRLEITVVPVLLGAGIPLYPEGPQVKLELVSTHQYPSGMMTLNYRPADLAA
jgi:dihydrofolate reductase